jgi:thioredoxin 1
MLHVMKTGRPRRVARRPWMQWALASALWGLGAWSSAAHALEVTPYSAKAFDEAMKAKRPVAVHFRTSWCTVCKAQQVLLDQMQKKAEPGYDLTVLAVDYDNDKVARERHKVKERSTLIAYGGGAEKARLEGSADRARIQAVLKAGLIK